MKEMFCDNHSFLFFSSLHSEKNKKSSTEEEILNLKNLKNKKEFERNQCLLKEKEKRVDVIFRRREK